MILVLKGADFSANNLGQVEITTELDAFTKAAIVASGNTSMTDVQKSALNTFFKKLGAFGATGVWSKIHYAWMPIIGGSLDKAFLNYKSNEVNVVPKSEYWSLVDGGIKSLQSGVDGRNNFKSTDIITGNNLSVACLYIDTSASNLILVSLGKDYYERNITGGVSGGGDSLCEITKHDGTQLVVLNSLGVSDNPRIVSVNGTNVKALINRNIVTKSLTEEISFTLESDNTLSIDILSYMVKGPNPPTNSGASMMFIGDALTNDEMLLINDAMKELKEKYLSL